MNFNFSSIIKRTNETLNVFKKIIPIYKEVKPFITKEKKIFNTDTKKESDKLDNPKYNNQITFFQ